MLLPNYFLTDLVLYLWRQQKSIPLHRSAWTRENCWNWRWRETSDWQWNWPMRFFCDLIAFLIGRWAGPPGALTRGDCDIFWGLTSNIPQNRAAVNSLGYFWLPTGYKTTDLEKSLLFNCVNCQLNCCCYCSEEKKTSQRGE